VQKKFRMMPSNVNTAAPFLIKLRWGGLTPQNQTQSHQPILIVQNPKNRAVAIILAFFLGGFGIHKFYLGRISAGAFYLLFCWTFIPALIAFFDFLGLIMMTDESFLRRYPA